ncbi:YbhB/YbcL family Raf kinase inhibitor-like protein [uncultured Dysosmobacter sp.]|uniref:YbhB/YbcL family Raf kinase inhibitor-like protein n=1 Tax=uncultured Dysosmobacter sp. TaxID=2591384 RepID=UPI00260EF1C3|nr:YbhB/YbcL family Raf kinase inhibitor-like protein [uncultured Dysosmobacter sp.]
MDMLMPLVVTSSAFSHGGSIPEQYTGYGEDVSPPFHISGLSSAAVSLAIILDDLDVPLFSAYPHWLIWDITPVEDIPAHIPHGKRTLDRAVQGIAYGRNRYRGPKPPFFAHKPHRYRFSFYALDCFLGADAASDRKTLVKAMKGHILQQGSILGTYRHA